MDLNDRTGDAPPKAPRGGANSQLGDCMVRSMSVVGVFTLLLAGCGGDSGTAPEPFPRIAGRYTYNAPANEPPRVAGLSYRGTLSLTDDGRDTEGFGGTYSVQICTSDSSCGPQTFAGSVANAKVAADSALTFDLVLTANPDAVWRHSGRVRADRLDGVWTQTTADGTARGTFTAIPQ